MSLRKLFILAAVVLAAAACKKDEETASIPPLNGALSFSVPEYVSPLQTVTMTPKGVKHPDGKELGYYWKVTPTMTKYDTTRFSNGLDSSKPDGKPSDGSFTHTFSDTLKTYTVYAGAYAKGYTTASAMHEVKVVKGGLGGSIKNTGIKTSDAKVTAHGVDYYYTTIGHLDWLRSNLANPASGVAYKNAEVMSDVFGRYYTYEEALTACPEGWRLPTDAEWVTMVSEFTDSEGVTPYSPVPGVAAALMADATFNGNEMWQYYPNVGDITNVSGLAIIPSGYVVAGKNFAGLNEYAMFWTADVVEGESDMAYYRYLVCDQSDLFASKGSRTSFGASVRCVREAQ